MPTPEQGSPSGFRASLQAQHWFIKVVLFGVSAVVAGPFVFAFAVAVGVATHPLFGFAVVLGAVIFGVWFLSSPHPNNGDAAPAHGSAADLAAVRYCPSCGRMFAPELERCPGCDAAWEPAPTTIAFMSAVLDELQRLRASRTLSDGDYLRLRDHYEAQIDALRPRPATPEPEPTPEAPPALPWAPAARPVTQPLGIWPEPAATEPVATAPQAPPAPGPAFVQPTPMDEPEPHVWTPPPPRPPVARPELPPSPPGPSIGDMGRTVIGWAAERQADILLYVGAFLLSIAAFIFVAYQGGAVSGTFRFAILTTYALGFLTFGLVLHRWERVKEAGPVFLALGAILVPVDFIALRTQVLSHEQLPLDVLWLVGSAATGTLYSTLALRGYGKWYAAPAVPAALAAWGALGSVLGLPAAWFGPWFTGLAAAAYVAALALRDRRAVVDLAIPLALVVGVAGLAWAHVLVAANGEDRLALPAGYVLATVGIAAGLRWWRPIAALFAVPALAGVSSETSCWALFDLQPEWIPVFAVATGLGYLVVAHFDDTARTRNWAGIALAVIAAGVIGAHVTVLTEGASRGPLPAAYALATVGASGAYARWRWAAAAALQPPVAAATVVTTWWAAGGTGIDWYGALSTVALAGYLALMQWDVASRRTRWRPAAIVSGSIALAVAHAGQVDEAANQYALPITYALVTVASAVAFARWRWDWRVAPGVMPALAATTVLSVSWAAWDLPLEWYGSFAAAAGLGYLVLAHFDPDSARARNWGGAALLAGGTGLVCAHIAVLGDDAARGALPATYGIVLFGLTCAFARWKWAWIENPALIPYVAAATGLSATWAVWDLPIEWWGCFAVAAGLGYLALGHFDPDVTRARTWGGAALAFGATGVGGAHLAVLYETPSGDALAPTYAIALVGVSFAFARWRWSWIESPALLPVLAAGAGLSFAWARWELSLEWWGSFAGGTALGWLLLAHFDPEQRRARAWWGAAVVFLAGGVAGTHATVLTEGAQREALPAAHGLAFVGASGAFARWRWAEAGALMPVAGTLTALTATWAANDVAIEWYGAFAAAAGLGYLALARFDRASRSLGWRNAAAACFALGIGLAHGLALDDPDIARAAVAVTDALALAGAAYAALQWRFAWRVEPGSVPLLAALAAGTITWAAWDIDPSWYGGFGGAAAAGYLALAWLDTPATRRLWLHAGLALASGGIVACHLGQAGPDPARFAVPIAYAEATAFAAAAAVIWRWGFREAVAGLPVFSAAGLAALGWAGWDMRLEWLPPFAAAAAAAYLVPAALDSAHRDEWRLGASAGFGIAIAAAHAVAFGVEVPRWELPAAYAFLVGASAWDAYRDRGPSTIVTPLTVSMLGGSALWAADVEPEWWGYPAMAVAAGIVASHRFWARTPNETSVGWYLGLGLAAGTSLAFLPVHYTHPAHGVALQSATAVLVAAAAVWSNGALSRPLTPQPADLHVTLERAALWQIACAYLFGSAVSLNSALGLEGADRGWLILGLGAAAWMPAAALGRRDEWLWTFAPIGLIGTTAASALMSTDNGPLTIALVIATVAPLVAFAGARRWMLLGISNSFLMLAVWAAWRWQEADVAYLPIAFAALAALEWAALIRLRRYVSVPGETDVIVAYISWGPWMVASAVAAIVLQRESGTLPAGETLVTTDAWSLAAAVLAMASAAVVAEGFRLRVRVVWLPATVGLLGAFLMAMATREPDNIQAYTAPIAVYVIGAALTFRRSPALFGRHVETHEAMMLAGTLLLVLPPAEQSFEPGGGKFGLELIGIGIVLLLVGLALHARWLVPAAIATLTAVSLRLVTGGMVTLPYWLLLGIAGTALISFGVLVLLERDRWDRFRRHVVEWWSEAVKPPPGARPPAATPRQ